ncbi:DUF4261 domain-containing protein [Paenibacillus pinihumi]|uniref:DUF4261 domain-containing protein n=1 Tax=Paenibacillus pinihumi TaxID=669462 RepID=UPI00040574E6|nr:DUF4261 domain-containing protein [Paenibacillus pinihumi]
MKEKEYELDDEQLTTDEASSLEEEDARFGFNRIYMIELLYKNKPELSESVLYDKIVQYTGKTDRPQQEDEQPEEGLAVWKANEEESAQTGMRLFFHFNYMVKLKDGEIPAQTCIMPADKKIEPEAYTTAIQQAWHWQEAGETVEQCRYSLLLHDFLAAQLPHEQRLQLINGVLRAVLETAPCDAVYFRASDKLVQPDACLAAIAEGEALYGAMSVRFYNVERPEIGRSEMLMDTLGLAALGVPDVQCHYYDMEPNDVASFVGDIGYYLFHNGDIIGDGETVGPTENEKWLCEHQYALAAPQRVVLDLNPGPDYYAGRQHHEERQQAGEQE